MAILPDSNILFVHLPWSSYGLAITRSYHQPSNLPSLYFLSVIMNYYSSATFFTMLAA